MKKREVAAACMIGLAMVLTGCETMENEMNIQARVAEQRDTEEKSKEIVCWGDSMTEGTGNSAAIIHADGETFDASFLSYPEILEELTGITTYNYGVYGATSEEIAIMQGALEPEMDLDEYDMIDFDIMEKSKAHMGDILILEIGSNGGWDGDYDVLIDQYEAMITHSSCSEYIIIGDTDNPGSSLADTEQSATDEKGCFIGVNETSWETALREAFGDHFINMRVYMVENGLKIAGLEETQTDRIEKKLGFIPSQLRADWTHFNSYGYYAKAMGVYKKGIELGYWK